MGRPKRPRMYEIKELINEEINNFIFEIFNKLIPTEFEKIKNNKYKDIIFDIYRFNTKSGNFYDVDFYYSNLDIEELDNLNKYFDNNIIRVVDIGFTSTDYSSRNIDGDLMGSADDPYNERTKHNEQYEVLGKVAYTIKEFIKENNNIDAYVIGKDSDQKNIKAYLHMFKNIFSSEFQMIEDNSPNYDTGAYYFIKK